MTRAKDISKILTDGNISGTLDVSGAFTSLGIDDNADATAITIDSSENVGIGTASPSALIHGNGSSVSALLLTTNSYTSGTEFKVQGDGASYIYNKQNAMLRFGTNNLERVRILSSGELLVGTTSDTMPTSAASGQAIQAGTRAFIATETNGDTILGGTSGSNFTAIYQGGAERLRIDSSGRMLLGTTTEGDVNGDDLTIATTGATGITIRSGTSSDGHLFFSDGTSGADEYRGYLQYNHQHNRLAFGTNATERMRIHQGGELTIGTTSINSSAQVSIEKGGHGAYLYMGGSTENNRGLLFTSSVGSSGSGFLGAKHTIQVLSSGGEIEIKNDNLTWLSLAPTGKVGIGTTSPSSILHVSDTATSTVPLKLETNGGSANTVRPQISMFSGSSNGYHISTIRSNLSNDPYGLVFTENSTERMRINSSGHLLAGTTSPEGDISIGNRIIGGIFATRNRFHTFSAVNTYETVDTFPSNAGTYLLTATGSGGGNATTDHYIGFVSISGSSAVITNLKTASRVLVQMSGLNLQIRQGFFSTANITYSLLRLVN